VPKMTMNSIFVLSLSEFVQGPCFFAFIEKKIPYCRKTCPPCWIQFAKSRTLPLPPKCTCERPVYFRLWPLPCKLMYWSLDSFRFGSRTEIEVQVGDFEIWYQNINSYQKRSIRCKTNFHFCLKSKIKNQN